MAKKKLSSIFNLSIRSVCTNHTQKGNILAEKKRLNSDSFFFLVCYFPLKKEHIFNILCRIAGKYKHLNPKHCLHSSCSHYLDCK
jgi:hypothetical protein